MHHCSVWLLIAAFLTACAISDDVEPNQRIDILMSASKQAIACRKAAAADSRYQSLAIHMPLVGVYRATLLQMADTGFATSEDVGTLILWTQDIQVCRQQLIGAVRDQIPSSLAVFASSWNKDDEVYVLLATKKLAWGAAVMRLRTTEAEMLSGLTDLMFRITAQLNRDKQAALSRRIAALTR